MTYSNEISRANPGCVFFLVDQSSSMAEGLAGTDMSKAQFVSEALNKLLAELSVRCASESGVVDYFHVAVLGYASQVFDQLGYLGGRGAMPLSRVAENPLRFGQETRTIVGPVGRTVTAQVRVPVWVEAKHDGLTAMTHVLTITRDWLAHWIQQHPSSFPPIVVNFTDGEANDGDAVAAAAALRELRTADGPVLLFNIFASSQEAAQWLYPSSADVSRSRVAQNLFAMSSVLPPSMLRYAREYYPSVENGARGMVFNAGAEEIARFLDIGTRTPDLRGVA